VVQHQNLATLTLTYSCLVETNPRDSASLLLSDPDPFSQKCKNALPR